MCAVFLLGELRNLNDHVPDMMEIGIDKLDRVMLLREGTVESDHEAFDSDEEIFRAFVWWVRADFGGEVNRRLAEEVGVVADLLGGSVLGHCGCCFNDVPLLWIGGIVLRC